MSENNDNTVAMSDTQTNDKTKTEEELPKKNEEVKNHPKKSLYIFFTFKNKSKWDKKKPAYWDNINFNLNF